MSTTDLMNISAFKGVAPAAAFAAALDPHSESLADGIGSSYGIVGYKGKVWTLRLRGQTYQFNAALADGSQVPAPHLDVIVLRSPPYKSKSYYPAGTYQDGQLGTRPICAALDGVTPDADIAAAQSTACAICPRNVFKLNAEGRKTRECSDYKRLSVLILPSLTKAILGAPLMEPVFLRVPAASLNDLALLGEGMSAAGFHYSSYITRIGFVADKPHPQMTFRALQGLTDREAPLVLPLRDDPNALRITGENEIGKPRAAPVTVVTNVVPLRQPIEVEPPAPVAAAPAPAQPAPAPAPAAAPVQLDTGFGDVQNVTVAVNPPAPVAAPVAAAAVETGFGDVGQAQTTTASAPTVNTVADTGMPEDADADLDARVAALLPK